MPRLIIKHIVDGTDLYLVWSTIVDAPVTHGMTLDELKAYWLSENGRRGLAALERDIEGGRWTSSLEDEIACNRAGEAETELTLEQIVDYYFVRRGQGPRPRGNGGSVPELHL